MDKANFFENYFNNAEVNSIMIMDCEGNFLDVNSAFTKNFGYKKEDISGKNFRLLFTEHDIIHQKPEIELATVNAKGQANDENYVVHQGGQKVWCIGESLLVKGEKGEKYIVKDIINLQARKQLQLFLTDTEELLERIFETSRDIPMMILDGSMKIININHAFLELFEIDESPERGSRLSCLDHPFWNSQEVKLALSRIIVSNEPIKQNDFMLHSHTGKSKVVRLDSKIVNSNSISGRKIFIIPQDLSVE
jgi:PAS domain S-box-containing protein